MLFFDNGGGEWDINTRDNGEGFDSSADEDEEFNSSRRRTRRFVRRDGCGWAIQTENKNKQIIDDSSLSLIRFFTDLLF